jgi:DNA-binding NtrC family response regulator
MEPGAMCIRVLIADSDVSLLESYCEHLSRIGFDVVTARNGLECVARLRAFDCDVLVIEMDIPWGGGIGVLDLLRSGRELQRVPTIIVTAHRHITDFEKRLLFDSSYEYRLKPLKPERLAEIIQRLLDNRPASFSSWASASAALRRQTLQRAVKPANDTVPVLSVWQDEELEPCAPRQK